MALLQDLNINDTGFLKISSGSVAQRPASPTVGQVRYNSATRHSEVWNGSKWVSDALIGDGLTEDNPAPNGYALCRAYPHYTSGTYWIQNHAMPNPLQMYVDMTEEGGGFDFYAFNGNGGNAVVTYPPGDVNFQGADFTHSGLALGLDIVYPRSKYHWRALSNFVRNVVGSTNNDFFQTVYGVSRPSTGRSGSMAGVGSDNYSNYAFRSARHYGSGVPDYRAPDGGRWWIRDDNGFTEPNGDYTENNFLGGYTFPNPYTLQDIGFNDAFGSNYALGSSYVVSTNAKP